MSQIQKTKLGRPVGGSKIPPELVADMAEKRIAGWSVPRLKTYCQARGVAITINGLTKAIDKYIQAGSLAAEAKTATREAIAPVLADATQALLGHLAESSEILRFAERAAMKDLLAVSAYSRAVDAYSKLHRLVQEASGATQPDEPLVDGLGGLLGLAIEAERAEVVPTQEPAPN